MAALRRARMPRLSGRALFLWVSGLLLLVVPPFLTTGWHFFLVETLVLVLFTLSLYLLMGVGGMASFGHAAYYGIGAYTVALLTTRQGVHVLAAMLAGPIAAALGAALIGYFCVRLSQAYFIMLTLAFSQLVWVLIVKLYRFTGGDDGISGIGGLAEISSPLNYYYFSLVVVVVCAWLLHRISLSPFGYALRAIRDNPIRAEYVGLPVRRYRWYAFIIGGFFAGVAGVLIALYTGSVAPQLTYWTTSARPFIAAILGGLGFFWGPVVGAVVLHTLETQGERVTAHWPLIQGVVTLLVALFLQQGIAGAARGLKLPRGYQFWWKRSSN